MNALEKEVRRIANEEIDKRKKLFKPKGWEKWDGVEDYSLRNGFENFLQNMSLDHGRSPAAIEERIIKLINRGGS